MENKYKSIFQHYEKCFDHHGDTCKGVDWPNEEDEATRHQVMLDIIKTDAMCSMLDFGCGTARFLDYIQSKNLKNINYTGLDISEKYISYCKRKYPNQKFICQDIISSPSINSFDYIVLNGVFTEKVKLTHDEMFLFLKEVIRSLFKNTNAGLAFNVMSKNVDWEREDLFYLGYDELASFINKSISKNFVFRKDYGLYEFTVYIFK